MIGPRRRAVGRAERRLGRAAPTPGELDLLRAAVLGPTEAAAAWRRWRGEHDVDTANWRCHAILPAVSANVDDDALGEDADRLRGLRRRAWVVTQRQLHALTSGLRILAPVGITPIVVKGAALATTVYTQPGTRTMGDVDVVVGAEHFDVAADALVAAGWRRRDDFGHQPFMHACSLSGPGDVDVDLHRWTMFPRHSRIPETSWFGRAVEHRVGGVACRRFTTADELVLTVLHGVGPSTPSSVRWPLDVVMLARAGAVDGAAWWDAVVASAVELGVGPPLADGLRLCREELGLTVGDEVLRELAASPHDRLLTLEWRSRAVGVGMPSRARQYVDTERVAGRSPSLRGYVGMRRDAARRGGGVASIVTRRTQRAWGSVRGWRHHLTDR